MLTTFLTAWLSVSLVIRHTRHFRHLPPTSLTLSPNTTTPPPQHECSTGQDPNLRYLTISPPHHLSLPQKSSLHHLHSISIPYRNAFMGNCISAQDRAEKAVSDAIDKQIEEDSRKFRKECKILLLGEPAHSFVRSISGFYAIPAIGLYLRNQKWRTFGVDESCPHPPPPVSSPVERSHFGRLLGQRHLRVRLSSSSIVKDIWVLFNCIDTL